MEAQTKSLAGKWSGSFIMDALGTCMYINDLFIETLVEWTENTAGDSGYK